MARDSQKTMPIMGHLTELRKRLTYIAIVLVVFVIAAFVERGRVFAVLEYPLHQAKPGMQLTTLGVTEPFIAALEVCVYTGLIITLPFILYQFWAFIMPALYEKEKRNIIPYVAATSALFLAGVAFAFMIVLPVGLKFMVGYGKSMGFNQLIQLDRYVSFVSMFVLAFGCVFELPLVMMLLAYARILDYRRMRKVRKYAILVEAIIAAAFTPSQDPFSMMLMLIPLVFLYEIGIWLAKIVAKRREKREQMAALTGADGGGLKLES